MKTEIIIGIVMITVGIIFGIIETVYFGYNMFPETFTETICDILSFGLVIFGVIKLNIIMNKKLNK